MKKKIIIRGLLGLPIGIAVGFIFSLIISIFIGNDVFYPVSPTLIKTVGNELDAVILQTSLYSLIGIGFSAASVIWEIDTWSLAKQSGIYFFDYKYYYVSFCLFCKLDGAYSCRFPFLCWNIYSNFLCCLDFYLFKL